MKGEIKSILDKLDNGEISCKKATKLIQSMDKEITFMKEKPATKIKVTIIDEDDNRNIKLPGIPFWLITSLGNLAFFISPLLLKYNKHIDEDSRLALNAIKEIDLKEILSALRSYSAYDLVNISSNKDIVRISVL